MIVEPLREVFRNILFGNFTEDQCSADSRSSTTEASRRRFRRFRQNFNIEVASKTCILVGEVSCPIIPTLESISAPSGALVDMREDLPEGALIVRKRRQRGRHSRKCLDLDHQSLNDEDRSAYGCHLCNWSTDSSDTDADDLFEIPQRDIYSRRRESINMMQSRYAAGPRDRRSRSKSPDSSDTPPSPYIIDHNGKKRKFGSAKIAAAYDPTPHDGRLTILDSGTTSHTLRDQDANYPNSFLPSSQNLTISTAASGAGIHARGRVAHVGPILEDVIVCANDKLSTSCISIPRLDIQGFTTVFNVAEFTIQTVDWWSKLRWSMDSTVFMPMRSPGSTPAFDDGPDQTPSTCLDRLTPQKPWLTGMTS